MRDLQKLRRATLVSTVLLVGAPVAADAVPRPLSPAVVPGAIQGGQGTTTGARPMVEVRVGNSKPVPVLLDTGSTGLQIYAPAVNTAPAEALGSRPQVVNSVLPRPTRGLRT